MKNTIFRLPLSKEKERFNGTSQSKLRHKQGRVSVLSWNIGWLYGMGSEGKNYHPKPRSFFVDAIKRAGRVILKSDCDLALLQEVDFESNRSHGLNMAKSIAPLAGLPYVAQATTWNVRHLPYPYWPIKNHWGKIDSGGAILSRLPISQQRVFLLPKPKEKNFIYRSFYLSRFLQSAVIQWPQREFHAANVHLEAFSEQNRLEQAKIICEELCQIEQNAPVILGGDFNAPPAWAKNKGPFAGEENTYQNDHSSDYLQRKLKLQNCLSPQSPEREEDGFTFPSLKPNRTLDYLYASRHWKCSSLEVLRCGAISDHLPIIADFALL